MSAKKKNSFEKWCEGLIFENEKSPEYMKQAIAEREHYVSKILSPEALKERWDKMNYKPTDLQLKIF